MNTISSISTSGNIGGNLTNITMGNSNIATLSSISNIGNVVVGNNLSNLSVGNNLSNMNMPLSSLNRVTMSNLSNLSLEGGQYVSKTGWEDVTSSQVSQGPGSGSTTMSADSSPGPEEPEPPRQTDVSPRKKPRKQL